MAKPLIEIRALKPAEAEEVARQFQAGPQDKALGVPRRLATAFGWTTWPQTSGIKQSFLVSRGAEKLLLFGIEKDEFNSVQLDARHARIHWLRTAAHTSECDAIPDAARALRQILLEQEWDLIALRILNHDRAALKLFGHAGFHTILTNGWFYRPPSLKSPLLRAPSRISFEMRSLRSDPTPSSEVSAYLAVARDGFFHDRISSEPWIRRDLVMKRFCAMAENGLRGDTADYLMTAKTGTRIEAFAFFGVSPPAPGLSEWPVAGKWLSGFSRSGIMSRGRCGLCLAESIRTIPEGNAYWIYACALDNFRSVETSRRLEFRLGMIAHDLHWRRQTIHCREIRLPNGP